MFLIYKKLLKLSIPLIILVLMVMGRKSYAQIDQQALINFYRNHQYPQIKQQLSHATPQDTSSLSYLFFKTLFIKNGQQAKRNYERVYRLADEPLKQFAAQRLHDYYYALGLYFKAAQYQSARSAQERPAAKDSSSIAVEPPGPFSEVSPFKIQFGAFSTHKNAQKQLELLQKNQVPAKIIKRQINGRQFYCVWVEGLKNIEETQKFAEQIRKQVHLDYRIIKP